jgi:hypothetical protein
MGGIPWQRLGNLFSYTLRHNIIAFVGHLSSAFGTDYVAPNEYNSGKVA